MNRVRIKYGLLLCCLIALATVSARAEVVINIDGMTGSNMFTYSISGTMTTVSGGGAQPASTAFRFPANGTWEAMLVPVGSTVSQTSDPILSASINITGPGITGALLRVRYLLMSSTVMVVRPAMSILRTVASITLAIPVALFLPTLDQVR